MTSRYFPRPVVTKDRYGYTLIDGYTHLGKNRIPPMPAHIIMEDRVSGLRKALSHTGVPGAMELDLAIPDDNWPDVAEFGPFDGPYYGRFRLYLESHILLAEPQAIGETRSSQRVLTRKDYERTMLDITVDAAGNVVYNEISV